MAIQLAGQFIVWLQTLAQQNMVIALLAVVTIAALTGLLLAVVLRLLRLVLPWLLLGGAVVFCWKIGLLETFWQWFRNAIL